MFYINQKGEREFIHGKEAWNEAKLACKSCDHFKPDDEDEQVTEYLKSCYNCCFRRWTMESFVCKKQRI